ncbi:betaine aldehyde dehydrogenase [Acanthamoeba castellanii str. Neff]|uniref:Betaine aldehyde dehydrogenase n=1 Tax=Acanthamoeba castellanii (strain ATCC 30010 / Neff) TaxID=1257118 RepID=L8GWQ6_ACACF|nr:betaine aldehyde dehydrogenase [Acanthamoeba castellanii str. Neff]ELR17639.1 betaine aldehyde dehydrogenase [Acanthamoeba castellanii str. Neff]
MQQAAGRTPVLTPSGSPLKFEAPAGRLYLGGEWVPPVRGGSLATLNPATEQVPLATAEDVDAAVKAARAAFGGWGDTSGAERARYLRDIAQGIENRKEELAVIESLDCGKPLREAQGDVGEAVVYFRYYAQLAETLDAEQEASVALSNEPNFRVSVRKEPVGVVAAITPWNYPLLMATQKVAAALAAGCAVVLKPSELSPLTALELAAIAHTVGLPGGVLNVLPGDGPHTGVDKVSFTGSVATGSRILAAAVPDIKKVSLELGGKSAMLVFEDADLDAAVEWIMFGIFFNQGQESIADELVRKLQQEVQKLRLGDPLTCEPPCMGPLISQPQLDKGFFVEPTIFRGVPQDSALWREEIFGPVLAIRTFNTEEVAVHPTTVTLVSCGL